MNSKEFLQELINRLQENNIVGEKEHRMTHENHTRKKKKVLAWYSKNKINVDDARSIAIGNLYDYYNELYELGWFNSGFTYNIAIEITDDEADILVNQLGLTEINYKNRKKLRGL